MVTIEMICEPNKISILEEVSAFKQCSLQLSVRKKIEAIFDDLQEFMSNIIPAGKQTSLRTPQQAG